MNKEISEIIKRLVGQRDHINEAISTLQRIDEDSDSGQASQASRRGRRPGKNAARRNSPAKKSSLSAEARERMAAAQRKRWAKQRKAAKKTA